MKTTKEDMILPVRYYVPSAFSLNLYSNTIEQVVFFSFSPAFSFSPPGYLVTFLVPAPVRLIIFSITAAKPGPWVQMNKQRILLCKTVCSSQEYLISLNFICICTDTVAVLNYALFICIFVWGLRQFCLF